LEACTARQMAASSGAAGFTVFTLPSLQGLALRDAAIVAAVGVPGTARAVD
jgi:hypothetical protein